MVKDYLVPEKTWECKRFRQETIADTIWSDVPSCSPALVGNAVERPQSGHKNEKTGTK